MACLETKPQLYSQWYGNKSTLKDKLKIEDVEVNSEANINTDMSTNVEKINLQEGEKKVLCLKNLLNEDAKAADFKWSLFVASCNSYRHATCLRPFPPMFIKNECKNIEELRQVIEGIPPLPIIYEKFDEPNYYENNQLIIDLLYWVLLTLKDPQLKSVKKNEYESILEKVHSEVIMAKPNLIFKLENPNKSKKEERWKNKVQDNSTFYAYHGSKLENFHSIINYGIQQTMSNPGLFGDGIYLSSELNVSIGFSPVGFGWGGSILGSELSCVALCEVVNHPDVKRGDTGADSQKAFELTVRGKIPNKYYLSTNSDLLRVRYLLVYSHDFSSSKNLKSTGVVSWFKQNKFLTFVLGYMVFLVSVGLTQNKNVEKYYKFFIQKAGFD